MSLEIQVQSRLAAVLPGKVFAVQAPANTAWPVITWQRISSEPIQTHEANVDLYQSRVQVSCFAAGLTAARALREDAVAALEGNHDDGQIMIIGKSENYEEAAQVYRADAEFYVWANN